MNSTGDRVAIGARYNDGNGSNSGSVRVYQYVSLTTTTIDVSGSVTKTYGDMPFNLYPTSNSNAPFLYESSVPSYATVDSNGLVTILQPGQTTITVYQLENENYTDASANTIITILQSSQDNPVICSSPEEFEYAMSTNSQYLSITNDLTLNFELLNLGSNIKVITNDSENVIKILN